MIDLVVIWLAKLAGWLSRSFGRGEASSLPGLVAERLRPQLLERLGGQLTDGVVLITGTNGKTTTTRMVAAVIQSDHPTVLVNRGGSNLTRGLLSSLVANADWRGRLKARRAVFEVDEAAFPKAVRTLQPKAVLVLNLFRDQLDRYGELNTLAAKLKSAIDETSAKVVLNADDPLVAWLGSDASDASYFGLESASVAKLPHDFAADSAACPICGRALIYDRLFYAHIGRYHCPQKNFQRPKPSVVGNATIATLNRSETTITVDQKTALLKLNLPGLYNVYNGLAAMALLQTQGYPLAESAETIADMPPVFGRAETVEIEGRKLRISLVKNPTGFNQVIQAYRQEQTALPAFIIVNDLLADGRDVSWLWDVAFEDLALPQPVTVAGTRALDLALRLKYSDVQAQPATSLAEGLKLFLDGLPAGGEGIILPTYTAMRQLRRQLARSVTMQGSEE